MPSATGDPADLRALYDRAESAIQAVSNTDGDVVVPAINELRYAGRHILTWEEARQAGREADEEFRRAERHCKRAIYDAYDAGLVYALDEIETVRQDYRAIAIPTVFAAWPDLLKTAYEVARVVEHASGNREASYEAVESYYQQIREHLQALEQVRPELNKALQAHNRTIAIAYAGLGVGALSLFGTVLSIFLAL